MPIAVARTHQERVRGLRGITHLQPGDGLFIPRCRAVHTFGMRLPIRVVYLRANGCVLTTVLMRPRRLGLPRLRARHVLELPSDAEVAAVYDIQTGPVEPVTVQVPSANSTMWVAPLPHSPPHQ